ncbi:MAG: NAD(+) diphosphatase [Bacteroides sp.]
MEQIVIDNGKCCFLFYKDILLVKTTDSQLMDIPTVQEVEDLGLLNGKLLDVVAQDGTPQKTIQLSEQPSLPSGWEWIGLRASFDVLPLERYLQAGKAYQILFWDNHSRFCPACGTPTEQLEPIMKRCPQCGYELYPPISTAIIVLVKRGEDELLLVHAHNFRGNFKGLVAGFLEAGETLEQCVAREVMEETGLQIGNIRYVASQSWPYPSGLMVGFVADYVAGEIRMQEEELSTAAFYHRDHLPEIPRKVSIARRLIDLWLERKI